MANYIVGDIQGCYSALEKALNVVDFNTSQDTLWLTGDLIARGPDSLETMKFVLKNEHCIQTVLGNHDLHFLSVYHQLKSVNPRDQLQPLLDYKHIEKVITWLRKQPLVVPLPNNEGYMSHAGLPPLWTSAKALKYSNKVSERLTASDYVDFLPIMYGNSPNKWDRSLSKEKKLRFAVNALTRMRYCSLDGSLDFKQKGSPSNMVDESLVPWFTIEPERFSQAKWIFGHWASLMGETGNDNVIALDTGYVWGNALTIYHFESGEKIQIR